MIKLYRYKGWFYVVDLYNNEISEYYRYDNLRDAFIAISQIGVFNSLNNKEL